jgi:hypothetical protein
MPILKTPILVDGVEHKF